MGHMPTCTNNAAVSHVRGFSAAFAEYKKRPLRNPTLRGHHVPSFDAPTPSSWRSSVRSRRTVRSGGEDRSWFGRPQAIKKAAGNAATRGRIRRKYWRPSRTTLFRQSAVPWASFTNCQKKGAVPPAPSTTHRPLTEGNRTKVMEEIPTGRRRHDKKSLV